MTPEEIKKQNTRVIEVMVRNSACQCKGSGDVPCLKHHRDAFSVFFFAKYNVAPFQEGKETSNNPSGTRSYHTWAPLATVFRRSAEAVECSLVPDIPLLERLVIPGRVTYNGEREGWCFYGRHGHAITARGSRLNEVSRRYAQRNKRARWPNKGFG